MDLLNEININVNNILLENIGSGVLFLVIEEINKLEDVDTAVLQELIEAGMMYSNSQE
jgi:hypothetical protein